MMRWFMPSYNGDFRLDPVEGYPQSCRLVMVEPTAGELELLNKFMAKARKKRWLPLSKLDLEGICRSAAKSEVTLLAPLAEAGAELAKIIRPKKSTITAFRYAKGRMEIAEGTEALEAAAAKAEQDGAQAAASVRRPTPSCPQCVEGAIGPASEVLQEFMTDEQHESWARHRALIAHGNYTGHRYLLAHRHTPLAARIGRICYDLDSRAVIHFHDSMVPPEEEVLAAKLILEHREHWLRNEATLFGMNVPGTLIIQSHRDTAFKNPFGDVFDGVADAKLTQFLGHFVASFVPMFKAAKDLKESRQ